MWSGSPDWGVPHQTAQAYKQAYCDYGNQMIQATFGDGKAISAPQAVYLTCKT